MKKLIALFLTLVLAMSMNVTAFAATISTGNQDIDVEGKYQDNTTTPTVYNVDVSWGAMQFTYTESGVMTWNPADHTYTDNTSTGWIANGNTVTVTNHSNADVNASFAFNALNAYNTVSGNFDVTSAKLAAGVVSDYSGADKVTATLKLFGSLAEIVTDYVTIGTITVTIS